MFDSELAAREIAAIVEEAYVYAFPMLMGYRYGYATYLQPASPAYAGPPNGGPYGEAVTLDLVPPSHRHEHDALNGWLHQYNHDRYHTAIDGPPISRVNNLTE